MNSDSLLASLGTLPDFRYAGLLWVPEVGLYASSTRFYDPGTTRWLNRDWIREQGGINMYGYAGGNPVMWIDPMGTYIGEHFETIEEAACDALAEIFPESIKKNVEYAGTITKDPNPADPKKPYYAKPQSEGKADSAIININPGDVASYHSHGDFSRRDPRDPNPDKNKREIVRTTAKYDEFDSLHFSQQDRDNHIEALAAGYLGFRSYLVNPVGNRKVWNGKEESQCECSASTPKTN